MSEESMSASDVASITSSVKEKDPRRVAAGKRAGVTSKQAKEAKRLEREKQEQATRDSESNDGGYAVYLVGGLVVVGALSYLGYLNKDKLVGSRNQKPTGVQSPPPSKKKSNRVFAKE